VLSNTDVECLNLGVGGRLKRQKAALKSEPFGFALLVRCTAGKLGLELVGRDRFTLRDRAHLL